MALWTNVDEAAGKPKYLNTAQKAETFFVDAQEAQTSANKAKGITGAGWWRYTTYTDAQSSTRHKAELLVAMSVDAATSTEPANTSVTAPAAATFTVAATINSALPLSYQWQKAESTANTVFADIAGATSASYTTGVTAVTAGVGATNGDKYRVVISATGITATSNAVTLTVA